jgi:hypothetical protein
MSLLSSEEAYKNVESLSSDEETVIYFNDSTAVNFDEKSKSDPAFNKNTHADIINLFGENTFESTKIISLVEINEQ